MTKLLLILYNRLFGKLRAFVFSISMSIVNNFVDNNNDKTLYSYTCFSRYQCKVCLLKHSIEDWHRQTTVMLKDQRLTAGCERLLRHVMLD